MGNISTNPLAEHMSYSSIPISRQPPATQLENNFAKVAAVVEL